MKEQPLYWLADGRGYWPDGVVSYWPPSRRKASSGMERYVEGGLVLLRPVRAK